MATSQLTEEADNSPVAFFANAFTLSFQGTELVMDFRQSTPRSNINGSTFASKHSVVMVSAQQAKMLIIILKEQIDAFEKAIGTEIKLPEGWKIDTNLTKPQEEPRSSYG